MPTIDRMHRKNLSQASDKMNQRDAIYERDEIIRVARQKNEDKTLTLEESNRLLEQFNQTLQAIAEQRNVAPEVDESWALELLREAEEDDVIVA